MTQGDGNGTFPDKTSGEPGWSANAEHAIDQA